MRFGRTVVETPCTVAVEHTNESLSAHVELDGDVQIRPGDRVQVHGAPIQVAFGHCVTVRRSATVHRANALEQAWTRLRSRFELGELYEVSFSTRRRL
jgi:uncharacterized Zn finger protein